MKEYIINTQYELEDEIRNLFLSYEEPCFRVQSRKSEDGYDFVVEADVDGKGCKFAAECKLRPTAKDIEKLSSQTRQFAPLLATVRLTDSLLRLCKECKVNCIDLNGRLWLRGEGLLVERGPNIEGRNRVQYKSADRQINFFSAKSSRLARMLLAYRDREWTQKELADLAGLSQGLVSRLLNYAADQGWIAGSRGNWTLRNFDALLDAWEQADNWNKRGVIRQYSGLASSLTSIAHDLLEATVGNIAYTQWFAANHRFPYTESSVLSAYRSEFLNEADRNRLQLREVDNGGKLWIIVPNDTGPFQAVQRVEGLPLVCDAQIYLDLLQVGLRGPEQAHALRDWEGFCR